MLGTLAHKILTRLPPETAHSVAIWGMKHRISAPGPFTSAFTTTDLFGTSLDNPLGIAAGFDKYAEVADRARDYGFGWIEEGSFTWDGGEGNKGRRLFRLEDGLLNRMGLNCFPSEVAADILGRCKGKFAVSIAKTHNPAIIGDAAIRDMVSSYKVLKHLGIYTTINISCPNTKEGKTFEQDRVALAELVHGLSEVEGLRKDCVFKLSPRLPRLNVEMIVEETYSFAGGYQGGNTLLIEHPKYGKGGKSGPALKALGIETIRTLHEITRGSRTLLGCGGVSSGRDVLDYINAGAKAVLAYNGFVSRNGGGPDFAHRVNDEYAHLVAA